MSGDFLGLTLVGMETTVWLLGSLALIGRPTTYRLGLWLLMAALAVNGLLTIRLLWIG